MIPNIKLLFVLGSREASHLDASGRELNEMLATTDKRWEIHFASSGILQYENLKCDYIPHSVSFTPSPASIFSRALYLAFLTIKSAAIIREYNVHAIVCKSSHLILGFVAYLTSRLTSRKCLIRVNEDNVLDIILFIKRLRTPIISNRTFLAMIEKVSRSIENCLFKRVDWIMTHGPMDYERIRESTKKVTFVPLYVDTDEFGIVSKNRVKQLKRKLLGIEEDIKVLLFVGRLHPEKDIETLFRAYRKVLETHRHLMLAIIGVGPEREKCRSLVEKLGLTDSVKFLGYIPHDQMAKYYNLADIYVLTSIWEEWSNTIMEAMASGVPVIATNVGGNPYLVKDGETGFLVPPKVPQVLAEKIVYALDHHKEMNEIICKAYSSMKQFSKRDIGELYKKTIVDVIRGREPSNLFVFQRENGQMALNIKPIDD